MCTKHSDCAEQLLLKEIGPSKPIREIYKKKKRGFKTYGIYQRKWLGMERGPSESAPTTMIHCKNHGKQQVKNQIVEKKESESMHRFGITPVTTAKGV